MNMRYIVTIALFLTVAVFLSGVEAAKDFGDAEDIADELVREAADNMPDSDEDGIPDRQEEELGTDPGNVDSDSDGVIDREEISAGTNPTDDSEQPAPSEVNEFDEGNAPYLEYLEEDVQQELVESGDVEIDN